MKIKVNLVPKGSVQIAKTNKVIKVLRVTAYLVVALMVTAVAIVLLVRGGLEARLAVIKNDIKSVDEQLAELKQREMELSYDSLILSTAMKIEAERRDFRQMINDAYALTPPGSWVDNLGFTDDSVIVSFKSDGIQSFRKLGTAVTGIMDRNLTWLGGAKVTSVARNAKAGYTTNVEMMLKSAKPTPSMKLVPKTNE